MVGTSIQPDSNTSDKNKRPEYFTPGRGADNSVLETVVQSVVSQSVVVLPCVSLCVLMLSPKPWVYAARKKMDAKEQVLFSSCATIYSKILEDAMQTEIDDLPLGMKLHR